jgi:hypothetical protein
MVECWKTVLLGWAGAVTVCGAGEWSVRVLPEPAETNAVTLRLGLQAGFLDGRFHPLRAECLAGPEWSAEPGVNLQATAAAEPVDRPVRVVHGGADGGAERRGITQVTRPLRRGVRHTLRLHGRRIAGSGSVWVTFTPVGGTAEDGVTQRVSLKNGLWGAHDLPVIPQRETAYRCRLAVKPGSGVELGSLSLTPDDAEAGWDHEALEALRAMRPGVGPPCRPSFLRRGTHSARRNMSRSAVWPGLNRCSASRYLSRSWRMSACRTRRRASGWRRSGWPIATRRAVIRWPCCGSATDRPNRCV